MPTRLGALLSESRFLHSRSIAAAVPRLFGRIASAAFQSRLAAVGSAQVVASAIIRALSQLRHAMAILFCFFLVAGIVGMGFFKGALRQRCFYETSPDSPPTMYRNISGQEFSAQWMAAFGELTSAQSMKILSPTLKRLNLSEKDLSAESEWLGSTQLPTLVRRQAYVDNLWRLALLACGSPGLPDCETVYAIPTDICTRPVDASDHVSLGGRECPVVNGSRTICRVGAPFFGEPNKNPTRFEGWCVRVCHFLMQHGAHGAASRQERAKVICFAGSPSTISA